MSLLQGIARLAPEIQQHVLPMAAVPRPASTGRALRIIAQAEKLIDQKPPREKLLGQAERALEPFVPGGIQPRTSRLTLTRFIRRSGPH